MEKNEWVQKTRLSWTDFIEAFVAKLEPEAISMKFSWVLHKVFEQAPSWEQSPSMQILAAKFFTLESKRQVLLVQKKNKWGYLALVLSQKVFFVCIYFLEGWIVNYQKSRPVLYMVTYFLWYFNVTYLLNIFCLLSFRVKRRINWCFKWIEFITKNKDIDWVFELECKKMSLIFLLY